MADLIERLRLAAKILRDIGGQSAMAETVEEAAAALEAAREDACVALVADIRFACGDNGKRMQPELVEFIRELAQDAERLDWLASEADTLWGSRDRGGYELAYFDITSGREGCDPGDLRSAIDQARGKGGGE